MLDERLGASDTSAPCVALSGRRIVPDKDTSGKALPSPDGEESVAGALLVAHAEARESDLGLGAGEADCVDPVESTVAGRSR